MANFAIIEDGLIINTIVAESKKIAEEVTGKTCIEFTTEPAESGGTYVDGNFIKRKPYPSWIRDDEYGWKAPTDYPEIHGDGTGLYSWDESKLDWIAVTV
jgi:hypothetical protein